MSIFYSIPPKLVLFDLDMTLVNTSMLESLRSQRKWSEVYKRVPETRLLYDPKDDEFQIGRAHV